jgi:hypothetical protein
VLAILPEPAATIVAVAAFTGARKGEIRGFLWEGYDGSRARKRLKFQIKMPCQGRGRNLAGSYEPSAVIHGSWHRMNIRL